MARKNSTAASLVETRELVLDGLKAVNTSNSSTEELARACARALLGKTYAWHAYIKLAVSVGHTIDTAYDAVSTAIGAVNGALPRGQRAALALLGKYRSLARRAERLSIPLVDGKGVVVPNNALDTFCRKAEGTFTLPAPKTESSAAKLAALITAIEMAVPLEDIEEIKAALKAALTAATK